MRCVLLLLVFFFSFGHHKLTSHNGRWGFSSLTFSHSLLVFLYLIVLVVVPPYLFSFLTLAQTQFNFPTKMHMPQVFFQFHLGDVFARPFTLRWSDLGSWPGNFWAQLSSPASPPPSPGTHFALVLWWVVWFLDGPSFCFYYFFAVLCCILW